ncbi:MAG TPA: alkaline phosphatase family protein [Candidatus Cybelea sp.]|nr:alkaline phosphatase family protein [Candidatus Cybelea sp.]
MRILGFVRYAFSIGAAVAILAGCGALSAQGDKTGGGTEPPMGVPNTAGKKIDHVIIIVQEGRSFNNLFLGYPGTQSYGYAGKKKIALKPVSLATKWNIIVNGKWCNGTGKLPDTDCRMNGFYKEGWTCNQPGFPPCPIKYPPYAYVPRNETAPYLDMAKQYALADEMFASNYDGSSFVSHQYLIAGQADGTTGYPVGGGWGCPGGPSDRIRTLNQRREYDSLIQPCFNNTTLGDELDRAGISWAYYASPVEGGVKPCGSGDERRNDAAIGDGIWSAYQAIDHICYGPDWDKDVISPPSRFLTNVANGNLRTVTWVTPTYANSDQAGSDSRTGPSWVASLVNAVGKSKYWNSSAIFVVWDGYGGWYDPEAPPYVDADGLGVRVPLLIISPYAKNDYVSHVHYETASILRFVEDIFGLQRLSASDARAAAPVDAFDFGQRPRKFIPIKAP